MVILASRCFCNLTFVYVVGCILVPMPLAHSLCRDVPLVLSTPYKSDRAGMSFLHRFGPHPEWQIVKGKDDEGEEVVQIESREREAEREAKQIRDSPGRFV